MPSRAQPADQLPGAATGLGVEAGGRLVEVDQVGLADDAERQVEAPLLAAGERDHASVALLGQADQLEQLVGRAPARVRGAVDLDRLAHGEVGVDAALLEDDADAVAHL